MDKKWFKNGNSFCPAPFIQFHLNTAKEHKLCCYTDKIFNSEQNFNSDEYKTVRTKILNNEKISDCEICYNLENNNKVSFRQRIIKDMVQYENLLESQINQHNNNSNINPYWYDLRISNNCNLACIMCTPKSSSTIAKNLNIDNSHLSYEPDIDINPSLIKLYLAGGEPFLIKKFTDILDKIKNTKCQIIINTNGTIITNHMVKSLSRFSNVSITISLDGFNEVNSFIRKNSDWDIIDKNIDKFKKLKYNLHVNTVVQKDNINNLYDLGKYIEEKEIRLWSLNDVLDNEDLVYNNQKIDRVNLEKVMELKIIKRNIQSLNFLKKVMSQLNEKKI